MALEPTVLVTGFEPFAGAKLNSSEEVLRWIEDQSIPGILCKVLPVEYQRSAEELISLITRHEPEIIIALGQAEGRSKVSFERIAINLDDAKIADNSGEVRKDQTIVDGGELALMASFPVRTIVDTLKEKDYPAEESLSAGAFVCNHLFYSATKHLNESSSKKWMDFVHLPLVPEQSGDFPDKPTLAREIQGKTVLTAIEEARYLWKG